MKTAVVMQPYFFPYLGYFQLVAVADAFVFLDDVNFIKGGWINRNRVLVNGRAHTVSVPLSALSSHRHIRATTIAEGQDWRRKLLGLLRIAYARAPYQTEITDLVEHVISSDCSNIAALSAASVRAVCEYVGVRTEWQTSSSSHPNTAGLRGTERVLNICQSLGATRYVNAPGGRELYSPSQFDQAGLELRFLRPVLPTYNQLGGDFVTGLSIIDLLMFNSPQQVRAWMEAYELE